MKRILPLVATSVVLASSSAMAAQKQPNIILILLDDVGYSDFGCYGSEIPTPNIDALARDGIRLRQFYNQARSAPTRASLLTGLYPHQVGYGSLKVFRDVPNYHGYVNETGNVLLPEVLGEAGYYSIMTGKWHVGYGHCRPVARGFDTALDAAAGEIYFYNDPRGLKMHLDDQTIELTDERLPKEWYSSHMWVEYGFEKLRPAIEADQPFFWYLAHNAAHFPLQAPAETIAKYRGKYSEGWEVIRNRRFAKQVELGLYEEGDLTPRNPLAGEWDDLTAEQKHYYEQIMEVYAAVIDELDKSIGELVAELKRIGEYDNTVIMLLSDNGGNAEPGMSGKLVGDNPGDANSSVFLGGAWADVANTPYYLYKHHAHEGGCNTPMIISYPDGIDPELCGELISRDNYGHIVDIMPTIVELSGAKYPSTYNGHAVQPMEGESLMPLIRGEKLDQSRTLFVEHEGNKMLRRGEWKAVQEYKQKKWQLYNMSDDPTELNDCAASNPVILKSMIKEYKKLTKRVGVNPNLEFEIGAWYTPVDEY